MLPGIPRRSKVEVAGIKTVPVAMTSDLESQIPNPLYTRTIRVRFQKLKRSQTMKVLDVIIFIALFGSIIFYLKGRSNGSSEGPVFLRLECRSRFLTYTEYELGPALSSEKDTVTLVQPLMVNCNGFHANGYGGNGTCFLHVVKFQAWKYVEHIRPGPCGPVISQVSGQLTEMARVYEYACERPSCHDSSALAQVLTVHLPSTIDFQVHNASEDADPPQQHPGYLKCLAYTYLGTGA